MNFIRNQEVFDGNPSYKRQFLERHRKVDWWPEWQNTRDMRRFGIYPDLPRGARIRNFNFNEEDIFAEEVKHNRSIL